MKNGIQRVQNKYPGWNIVLKGPYEVIGIADDVGGSPCDIATDKEAFTQLDEAVKLAYKVYEEEHLLDVLIHGEKGLVWMITGT